MSYVDLIIKYLSGDLGQEEACSFEKELASNDELKEEFEEVSAAYSLVRDQLQTRDLDAFRKKLEEAMDHDIPVDEPRKQWFQLRWFIPLAAACSLVLIFLFTLKQPGDEKVLSRFYDPLNDPVVLAFNQDTRGEPEPGILQYRNGDYGRAMELLAKRIATEGGNKLLHLYYLLSAIELDRQDEALGMLTIATPDSLNLPDQALTWYTSMALLKAGKRDAALERIRPLTKEQGPYHSDALKLEKVLLK